MNSSGCSIVCLISFALSSYPLYGQEKTCSPDTIGNIRLREVVVTATQPDRPGTSSAIGPDAIRHIQATDLSDLSQLLPGVTTRNPNLHAPAVFTIRSATYENATNALGTAIVVDGMRMSNNANLQLLNLSSGGNLFNGCALSGFDVRFLSPASIESVEVIRGIPSARHGDLTSGAVIVNSKAGAHPFSVSLRLTATEKLASAGKGFRLRNNQAFYFGTDYALSSQDARMPELSFRRFGLQAAYSKDFAHATVRLNLRAYRLQNKDTRGANTVDGEYRTMLDRGFSFSANGQWKSGKSFITSLEYHAGVTYGSQRNEANTYYSGTRQVTTYARQPGEQEGVFLPPNYFAFVTVEGKPVSAEASLIAHIKHNLHKGMYNHLQAGIQISSEGNRGVGIQFDPLRPPLDMRGLRTRSYRDIPFMHHYTGFAEDKLSFSTGALRTELQAGLRISKLQTPHSRQALVAEPRINVRQSFKNISIRAGWGRMHKMPVLAYLYPDRSYTDMNCFTYNDTENGQRLTVMHTFATDRTFNPELRLPVNRKIEVGIHFHIKNITADIVWFNERLRNGYCATQQAAPFTYRRYEPLLNKGEQPALAPTGIVNNGHPLPFHNQNTFAVYSTPQNGIEQKKQGVEYTFDLGQWPPLHTSLLISGRYLQMTERNTALCAWHPQTETNGQPYPYAGIYAGGSSIFNRKVWQQLNTRFLCITQLPRLGLITTLSLQAVWMDKQQRTGDATDIDNEKLLYPAYYMNSEGALFPFGPEQAADPRFADLIIHAGTPAAYRTDSFGPYFLLNLRVTKKIGAHVSVAFCANNLTVSRPKRYTNSTRQYTILNPALYYGAEIAITF